MSQAATRGFLRRRLRLLLAKNGLVCGGWSYLAHRERSCALSNARARNDQKASVKKSGRSPPLDCCNSLPLWRRTPEGQSVPGFPNDALPKKAVENHSPKAGCAREMTRRQHFARSALDRGNSLQLWEGTLIARLTAETAGRVRLQSWEPSPEGETDSAGGGTRRASAASQRSQQSNPGAVLM